MTKSISHFLRIHINMLALDTIRVFNYQQLQEELANV